METLNMLASLSFGDILAESIQFNQTDTGRQLLEKYSTYTMSNHVTCNMVNQFLKEAKNCMYDAGVVKAADGVTSVLNENTYSWALLTVCENINKNTSKFNNLNINAAKQVMTLLEGRNEEEVVSYIKAGALKNVMHCGDIRQVVKNIYKAQPAIVETQNFKVEHPISFTELKDDKVYFMMEGRTFELHKDMKIVEAAQPNTSRDFTLINNILNKMAFDDDTFSYTIEGRLGKTEYQVSEQGMITKIANDTEIEMTVEECRENNRLFVNTLNPAHMNRIAGDLEGICKISENFDQIALLEEVSMVRTRDHRFSIVEGNESVVLTLHQSAHRAGFTKTFTSIVEALNDVKNQLRVDLTSVFENSIENELNNNKIKEEQQIKESLKASADQTRRSRIDSLTEKYKNDPATLAVLAALSAELI